MSTTNLLLPFTFHNMPVRGRLLRLTGLAEHVPALKEETPCTQTLAELLAAAAMLAHDTKHTLAVSLQLQHPVLGALAFAHCGLKGELKAYANDIAKATPFGALSATEGGLFAVTLEPENIEQRYQSLIPLNQPSAAACLAYYFQHSVQTPTLFVVFADTHNSCALMLQKLPSEEHNEDDWNRLQLLLNTLKAPEALDFTTPPETLLARLFAEDDLSTFPPEHPEFVHDDPRPRMLAALSNLPAAELAELIEQGTVTLTDQTTGQSITFTAAELAHLQDDTTPSTN